MFILLLVTASVLCLAALYAFDRTADTFHPLMFLCPMLAFMYVWMPAKMYATGQLYDFYREDQAVLIQTIYLIGCIALILGCLVTCPKRTSPSQVVPFANPAFNRSLRGIVLALGCLAWIGWLASRRANLAGTIGANGGLDGSGYAVETYLFLLPSASALLLTQGNLKKGRWTYLQVLFLSFPLLHTGLADARRGPTFMIAAALAISWCLRRRIRPSRLVLVLGGSCLGILMLYLFANRGGNLWSVDNTETRWNLADPFQNASSANEYIYGGAGILHTLETGDYYWGRRYLAQVIVRPVPRYIWPNKYADFGVPELDQNAGTRADEFANTVGFTGAVGAAPGIVGDLWLEFSWLAIPAMALIGWLYGVVWRKAMACGGTWMIQYIILIALSIYLVTQTMEAVIFRLLIMSLPFWCITAYLKSRFQSKRHSALHPLSALPAGT